MLLTKECPFQCVRSVPNYAQTTKPRTLSRTKFAENPAVSQNPTEPDKSSINQQTRRPDRL